MQAPPTATEKRYRELLSRQLASGMGIPAFAAGVGVNAGTLKWWKYETRRRDKLRTSTVEGLDEKAPVLLPVQLKREKPRVQAEARFPFELVLERGLRLRIAHGFDRSDLCRLLNCLGGGLC